MPAKSESQQRLVGMALAAKRGKGHFSEKIHEIADSMSEKQLRDFAKTKHKDLPEKKADMTIQEQAYVEGFTKRASEYGLDSNAVLELLKTSGALSTIAKMQASGASPKYLQSILTARKGVADEIRYARNGAKAWAKNPALQEAYSHPADILQGRISPHQGIGNVNDRLNMAIRHSDHISPTNARGQTQSILSDDLVREAMQRLRPRRGLANRVSSNIDALMGH